MRVVLGVGGGIAAYKAAELARTLMERGATVEVVLTAAGQQFITPLTFAALTGRKVITGLFETRTAGEVLSSAVEHIRAAQENDLLVVAPATADLLARFAHGLAGDFLTTLYLAFRGPVVLAPAMNTNMWEHPATQANLDALRRRGHTIVPPEEGLLACGVLGIGRLADPARIAGVVVQTLNRRDDYRGETVLVTAGPTQEPLDPVRYITNRSSGKMGYALAEAALARGARVVLVSGPVPIHAEPGIEMIPVRTAAEMREAVLDRLEAATIIIKAAAVADYHLENPPASKVKKTAMRLTLDLAPTPDILAEAGGRKGDRLLVGFAAETENLVVEARRKMETKNCDMVVANLVNQAGVGFESDGNEVVIVRREAEPMRVARAPKREIADTILDQILKLRLPTRSQNE